MAPPRNVHASQNQTGTGRPPSHAENGSSKASPPRRTTRVASTTNVIAHARHAQVQGWRRRLRSGIRGAVRSSARSSSSRRSGVRLPDRRPTRDRSDEPPGRRPADRADVRLQALAVVVVLYLDAVGLSGAQIGLLLTLTLLGDAAISLWLTAHADAAEDAGASSSWAPSCSLAGGLAFAATPVFAVLLVAATIGVVGPSGETRWARSSPSSARSRSSSTPLAGRMCSRGTSSRLPWPPRSARWPRGRASGAGCGAPADAYRIVVVGLRPRGRPPGGGLLARLAGGRGTPGEVVHAHAISVRARAPPLPSRRDPAVRALRARCLRGRARRCRASSPSGSISRFGVDPAVLGSDPLRGECAGGDLARCGLAPRRALFGRSVPWCSRTPVERAADPRPPHAHSAARRVALLAASASARWTCRRGGPHHGVVAPTAVRRRRGRGDRAQPRGRGVTAHRRAAAHRVAYIGAPFVIAGTLKIVYDVLCYRQLRPCARPRSVP